MQISIRSVPQRVITDLTATFGSDDWIAFTMNDEDPDDTLRNVFVNDRIVTLKTLDSKIQLDVGGIKADISEWDFRKVEIV